MKIILIGTAFCIAMMGTGCGAPAVNSNNSANANTRTANNSNGSAVGNAVNTVANGVSNAASSLTTDSPEDFVETAARAGVAEVEMGKLAAQKATDAEVKRFGQMMVDEHTRANAELKTLAGKKNWAVPEDLGSHQSDLDELKGLSGADFDKAYVKLMVNDHENDVAAFASQANNSSDPDVKAFAAKTLPVLKKHLETVQTIHARINK